MSRDELLIVVGMAVAVYLPKVLPLVLVPEQHGLRLRPWLRYVAPAVLGALVGPSILAPGGRVAAPSWDQAAYAVGFLVAVTTRRTVAAVGAGMLTLVVVTVLRP